MDNMLVNWTFQQANRQNRTILGNICSRKPRGNLAETSRKPRGNLAETSRKPCGNLAETSRKPRGNLAETSRKPRGNLAETSRKPRGNLAETSRKPRGNLAETLRKPRGNLAETSRKPRGNLAETSRKPGALPSEMPRLLRFCHDLSQLLSQVLSTGFTGRFSRLWDSFDDSSRLLSIGFADSLSRVSVLWRWGSSY